MSSCWGLVFKVVGLVRALSQDWGWGGGWGSCGGLVFGVGGWVGAGGQEGGGGGGGVLVLGLRCVIRVIVSESWVQAQG